MFAKRVLTVLFTLAFTSTTFATQRGGQHGGRGSGGHKPAPPTHQRPHEDRHPRENHRPNHGRDGRNFDRNTHHHISHHHTRVNRYGRVEFFWGGYWFGCDRDLPYWVFYEDVYIEMIGPGIYAVFVYNNPAMMVQVIVVD